MQYELENLIIKVISLITSDEELCKYIKYNTSSPLDGADFNYSELVNKNIHPLPKIPNASDESGTYVNLYIEADLPSKRNRGFTGTVIEIDVLCHLTLWLLDDGIRPYRICKRLKSLIESANIDEAYSLTELVEMKKAPFSDDYHGYKLFFSLATKR